MPDKLLVPVLCFAVYYVSALLFVRLNDFLFGRAFDFLAKRRRAREPESVFDGYEGIDFRCPDCVSDSHSDVIVSVNCFGDGKPDGD